MLKSPEEYLSSLTFESEAPIGEPLDAAERAFVEKYLGLDALEKMPVQNPEPVLLPAPLPQASKPAPVKERQIVVAPAPPKPAPVIAIAPLEITTAAPKIVEAPAKTEVKTEAAVKAEVKTQVSPKIEIKAAPPKAETAQARSEVAQASQVKVEVAQAAPAKTAAKPAEAQKTEAATGQKNADKTETAVKPQTTAKEQELSLRDKMRAAEQIQTVSFLVAGQLFLLPVMGIQEVVRYMELVKVPQAPSFIAGAINLRGKVLPLVYLSELLTNNAKPVYNEKSFVIITGEEALQVGLIVDRVNSMHMIEQKKFIWNAESKIGDAAEFLNAIVDLNDKVCGLVSVEAIKQKILSEF